MVIISDLFGQIKSVMRWNITVKDILKLEKYPLATKDTLGRLAVGAAVGVKANDLKRVERLLEAEADCLVVDIAHGDSKLEVDIVKNIRKNFPEAQIIVNPFDEIDEVKLGWETFSTD